MMKDDKDEHDYDDGDNNNDGIQMMML